MKSNYLISNKYKPIGWALFILGFIGGIFVYLSEYEADILNVKVFSLIGGESMFNQDDYFSIIENSILDELITIFIIIGGFIVGFSREKVEDEFIYKLRKDSLVWALIVNYTILILATLFVYNFAFFDVLIFNMFTPLIFFIIRFNFLKRKLVGNEE